MKRIAAVVLFLVAVAVRPAHAQFSSDGPILSMMYAEDKAFHAFMQLQVVQQLATLKANYNASVGYYNQFQQLNSGRGLLQNVDRILNTSQQKEDVNIQQQLTQTFQQPPYARKSATDDLIKTLNQAISSNIKYAGDEMANVISDRQQGVNVAQNANGLAPKDAANLSAQTSGLQLQMLANIHEDNLRMLQMQSAMLSQQTQQDAQQSAMIGDIQQSLQSRGVTSTNAGGQ